MIRIANFLVAACFAVSGAANAAETVVVELFTSQGCSSCPPADRILSDLADEQDVIALSYHVDYWDYLGWKDQFASPEFTNRQRSYARAKGERTIYTPQVVVGGVDHAVGSRGMSIAKLVRRHSEAPMPISVRLQRHGDSVSIVGSARGAVPEVVVQIVTFTPSATVDIKRGENAGRTMNYRNIVRSMKRIGTWNGQGNFSSSVNLGGNTPVAVLFQARNGGAILGAAQLR
ncbi:MAG: DUF1223 domain-containing protein [Silicimonas sp.]|nr:DUF1223 domain-containing protein [Silicimonas sp.]